MTALQAEWLRRCDSFTPAPAPPEVLDALVAAGMVETTDEGHKINATGLAFLQAKDLLIYRRPVRASRRRR